MAEPTFIPVNEPLLDGNEKRYVQECIDTGWISSEGPFVTKLEAGMAKLCNRKHGIAVANGSVALDLSVAALDIGAGDEVILPSFTIISCAAAIVRAGAVPVPVDADPINWNMTPGAVEKAITPRTRAIMVVHIYGLPVDMDPILDIAARHGLRVIEDAAEVHGQTYNGRPCGSFGDISTFSFYPNKHVTTGEGGMVLVNDPDLAARCRRLRNLGFSTDSQKRFIHEELGWNFRMSNLQAAIGVAQLERLDEFVQRKRAMGARYVSLLSGCDGIQLPLERTDYATNIYWVFGVVLDERLGISALEMQARLNRRGVGTRPFFFPMHQQPVFRKKGWFGELSLPVAEGLYRRGFYIPSGLALKSEAIDAVATILREELVAVRPVGHHG
jgi:perosamine synthetase